MNKEGKGGAKSGPSKEELAKFGNKTLKVHGHAHKLLKKKKK